MSTYGTLLKDAEQQLSELEYSDAALEARELLGKALDKDCRSAEFELLLREEADGAVSRELFDLCSKRIKGEPLQYIIGEWDFYGLRFKLGEGVLIPRQDTEMIIETAVKLYKNSEGIEIADLCAGTGCIGITLEKQLNNARLTLVEKYDRAFGYLSENAELHGSRAKLVKGDVEDQELISSMQEFDLIVSNPPYLTKQDMDSLQTEVRAEPREALYGGGDGLDYYRSITRLWKHKLKEGGALMFEIGAAQAKDVMELMIQHGFRDVRVKRDLAGNDRVVVGFKRAPA